MERIVIVIYNKGESRNVCAHTNYKSLDANFIKIGPSNELLYSRYGHRKYDASKQKEKQIVGQ